MRDKETKNFIKRTSIIGIMLMVVAAFVMSLVYKEDTLGILSNIYNVISPILLGLIIAYIVNFIYVKVEKLCNKLIKNKKNTVKILSVLISETIAIGIVVIVIIAIIPSLVENIKKILYELPSLVSNTQDWVNTFLAEHESIKNIVGDHSDLIQSKVSEFIADYDVTSIMNRTVSLVSETFTYTLNIVVAMVINVMVLINKETMISNAGKTIRAIFGKKYSKYIIEEIRVVDKKFSGFLVGKIVDSLIIGILAFIGVSILGINYAALIAFIIGVTNIVPIIGPFIGAVPCVVIVLGQ
jgi:predicted PurR-regulated permease PerM